MSFSSILHLDTSILLPMLDRNQYLVTEDERKIASSFRYHLERNNFKVKVSIVALGELSWICLRGCSSIQCQDVVNELTLFKDALGDRFECCIERFRENSQNYYSVLKHFLSKDDYLRDSPSDALILTAATLDSECDILYTFSDKLLLSKRVKDATNQVRKKKGFKTLKIDSP